MEKRAATGLWIVPILTWILFSVGCNSATTTTQVSLDGRVSPAFDGPPEVAECSETRSFTNPVTISGSATYQARITDINVGLGEPGSPQPIRRAEVRVLNGDGIEVQCAQTDNSGNFSFTLPKGNGTYRVQVLSRSNSSYIKASVLDAPERNQVYMLEAAASAQQSGSMGSLNASAKGDILGGAFNIFDKILKANEYLMDKVGLCSGDVDNCVDFSVTTKVSVYWERGFNPNSYFGASQTGLSFYLPGYRRLFILGGINGDTDNTDTDHFDDSIILHEYGHFLEDAYSSTDSPGGYHGGNSLIDARLAWSEGWGNFIQAAILDNPYYIDTLGNSDGSTGFIFNINLETPDDDCTPSLPGCDEPVLDKEGNFREFAITRFLWDTIDDDNDSENLENGFPEIWATMSGNNGFLNANVAFRSIGLIHSIQDGLTLGGSSTALDWSGLRTLQKQNGDRSEYAQYAIGDSATCSSSLNFSIDPYYDNSDSGSFSTSHLLRNNDFYHIKHEGGTLSVTLNYQTTGGPKEIDMDLYLYNEDARFGQSEDIVAYSWNESDGNPATPEQESFSVNLPAGNYLLNVMIYTGSTPSCVVPGGQPADYCDYVAVGDDTDYELIMTNGERLCPSTLP